MRRTVYGKYYEKCKWHLLSFTVLFQICPYKSVVVVGKKLSQC